MKKKIFLSFVLLATIVLAGLCSCNGCAKGGKTTAVTTAPELPAALYHDYDGVVQDFTASVAHIQSLHRQTMYHLNGGDCQWRNSKVTLNEDLTYENIDDLHIVSVTDVFQLFAPDPVVQFISTDVEKGTILPWPMHDLWIEDANLNDAEIKVTAEQALQRLKQWNGVLPKGKSLSLRLPIGPKVCNAQWVVGDVFNPLFIDAVTGEVRDWCPAFPRQ